MEQQQAPHTEKKLSTVDWVSLMGGIFITQLIFKMGDFGFIPALIIAFGSIWLVRKIVSLFLKKDTAPNSVSQITSQVPSQQTLDKLHKTYKTTGILSMSLAVVGFISAMVVGYKPENIFTDLIVALIFAFPRFYFGMKLMKDGINNLKYAFNVSKGMLIYSIVVALFNLLSLSSGWLYYILIYFYFKSYKDTKKHLFQVAENEKHI